MSADVSMVPPMAGGMNPWRRLRGLADWTLHRHHGGDMGWTDHPTKSISLRVDLTWEERRCTVLHECLHAEHGPVPEGNAAKHEMKIRKATARIMLPDIRAIGDALAWSGLRVGEAADELGVDAGVLWDRLDHLHPAERGYLTARLADH